jgi:hypothetical protein
MCTTCFHIRTLCILPIQCSCLPRMLLTISNNISLNLINRLIFIEGTDSFSCPLFSDFSSSSLLLPLIFFFFFGCSSFSSTFLLFFLFSYSSSSSTLFHLLFFFSSTLLLLFFFFSYYVFYSSTTLLLQFKKKTEGLFQFLWIPRCPWSTSISSSFGSMPKTLVSVKH